MIFTFINTILLFLTKNSKFSRRGIADLNRFLKIVFAACSTVGLVACSDSSVPSAPPVDHGRYYRMTVGLTYKGQPVDIDFVAGCGVHVGRDAGGGSIKEIAGMTDLLRGVPMPEGHAVIINTYPFFESPRFSPCDGDTTSSGRIPKDWLPFIVWFENDKEFAHGVGYLTQDAYESKNARFGFRYAAIEHATKDEFEAFRKAGSANLLPPHQTDWTTGGTDPRYRHVEDVPESVRRNPSSGWWKTSGRVCHGVIRTRLGGHQRAILADAWPKDHPDYWTDGDLDRHVPSSIIKSHRKEFTAYLSIMHFRLGGVRERPVEVFPVTSSFALSQLTAKTSPIEDQNVIIGDGVSNLGQVFCDVVDARILPAVTGQTFRNGCIYRIDGVKLSWSGRDDCSDFVIAPFFYRDEGLISTINPFGS